MHKLIAAGALTLALVASGWSPATADGDPAPWNSRLAAAYLDQRTSWWMGWQNAQRDCAAGAQARARRGGAVGDRRQADRQRDQTRADVEGRRAVLSRSDARHPE